LGRIGLGAAVLARPTLPARAMGVDTVTARRLDWLAGAAAVRDVAIGMGALEAAARGRPLRPWLVVQGLSDTGDAALLGVAVRRRQVSPVVGVATGALALALAAGEFVAAHGDGRRETGGGDTGGRDTANGDAARSG
jgi:hypothetical protein